MARAKAIFGFIFLLISSCVWANDYVLVSDLDDTLKITNGKNPTRMIYNAFFTQKTFLGMPKLYKSLNRANVTEAYILSASPFMVRKNINKLIKKFDLSFKEVYLRGVKDLLSKREYKLNRLRHIIKNTGGKLILFGDNQSIDADIYLQIKKEFPQRVHKIFIHKVRDELISSEVFSYITAFEVAQEMNTLLNEQESYDLFKTLMRQKKVETYIPNFTYCPTNKWMKNKNQQAEKLQLKVIKHCKKRQ